MNRKTSEKHTHKVVKNGALSEKKEQVQAEQSSQPSLKESHVDLSWKRYVVEPIARIHVEGWKILAVMLGVAVIVGVMWNGFWCISFPLLAFGLYFFRNPQRVSPIAEHFILAPADGIVSNIKPVVPPKELDIGDEPLTRISIFMSVFSVHVNRSPISGIVHKLFYHHGKFVSVQNKDSEDNERQEISVIMSDGTKIGFVQIAGLVARRIYCPLKIGDKLKAGQVFGLIRFGSRLDVFLPKGVKPKVWLGQTTVAGETILADLKNKD